MKNFVCWFVCIFSAAVCYGLDKIGSVVAVEGTVKAVAADQNERILNRNSAVFVGDTLITDLSSKGQIQFADGTLVLLIPGSQFIVDAYASGNLGKNQFTSKLSKGGIRVSTGLIAKKNPENFEVQTANATIGVRGTIFEARDFNGTLYVGGSSGNLRVKNSAGSLDIGSDQPTRFTSVSSGGSAPEPLAARPDALDLSNFTPPSGATAFDRGASQPTGAGAMASRTASTNSFAWGPAVGAIVVIGAVAGIVGSAASQSPSTFSH